MTPAPAERSRGTAWRRWNERASIAVLRRRRPRRGPRVKRLDIDGRGYDVVGAQLCIVDGDRVLVQFRPFPPGWELPGGHCEPDESPAETAAREAREECGLEVRVTGLVGVYTWSGLRAAGDAVYRAEVSGGHLRRTLESWSTRWVTPAELPRTTFPWIHERAVDALAAGEPVHRVQHVTPVHVLFFGVAWVRWIIDTARRRLVRRR